MEKKLKIQIMLFHLPRLNNIELKIILQKLIEQLQLSNV